MALKNAVLTGALIALCLLLHPAEAEVLPGNSGPYNARFLEGGIGLERKVGGAQAMLGARAPFTFVAWVRPDRTQAGFVSLISLGETGRARTLGLVDAAPGMRVGDAEIVAPVPLSSDRWTHVAAVSDGAMMLLYVDGKEAGRKPVSVDAVSDRIAIAPVAESGAHFGGQLVDARVVGTALSVADLLKEVRSPPSFDLVQMLDVGVGWEFQKRANIGLFDQQDPWTLPKGKAPFSKPVAKPVRAEPALRADGTYEWVIGQWRMIEGPRTAGFTGAQLSSPGFDARAWYAATVPGTALTTLVDRGVYPDPYFGLDNMAIPESLSRQDYWYRAEFSMPVAVRGRKMLLRFGGINYASEIWINGEKRGQSRGAFTRVDVPFAASDEPVAVAVRVLPPPHPGIPHEQSMLAGPGENGGQLAIDGPTFVATEGWDWIPGIRDRNIGLWQDVRLIAHDDVRLGDVHVRTDLPLPDVSKASLFIDIPLVNSSAATKTVTVALQLESLQLRKTVSIAPGTTLLRLSPETDPALSLASPRLWWPNGYGEPNLYKLQVTLSQNDAVSEEKTIRFGIREVSYELSLFDSSGRLRRVEVQPTDAGLKSERLVDVRHEAIKQTPAGWAMSLTAAGEKSSAVRDIPNSITFPHLTIRVNGVRIAARGGNWGMDDAMKRADRSRLESYFRLQKEAHLNIIRNWMGNNNEPEFFDLADENGMMIMNDFWQSTQDFQVEPQDAALFLANARDTVARYRNHPSIILWFGRNEGVPYPLLNEGLDDVIAEFDGTRLYMGSSNVVNLQGSGPYNYRDPEGYFTSLASGFSVETGTPSLATLEALEAMIPKEDRWPLGDTHAYHDWHFGGNGDTRSFMAAMNEMFGQATSLTDFERKAQMMNLETHKAMYEGFLAHLWTRNSGRLLWMTHPAWPSNAWQIYSSDYDTHAAYFGVKTANVPIHPQLDLPDNRLTVINTTLSDAANLKLHVTIHDLGGNRLDEKTIAVDAPANRASHFGVLDLAPYLGNGRMILVSMRLATADGTLIAENFYWRGRNRADYRQLSAMPTAQLIEASVAKRKLENESAITVTVSNRGKVPALALKLVLIDRKGARILPAYYSDNYISVMPGESRKVEIRARGALNDAQIRLRGWNMAQVTVR